MTLRPVRGPDTRASTEWWTGCSHCRTPAFAPARSPLWPERPLLPASGGGETSTTADPTQQEERRSRNTGWRRGARSTCPSAPSHCQDGRAGAWHRWVERIGRGSGPRVPPERAGPRGAARETQPASRFRDSRRRRTPPPSESPRPGPTDTAGWRSRRCRATRSGRPRCRASRDRRSACARSAR